MSKELLFKPVECNSFFRKAKNQIRVEIDDTGTKARYMQGDNPVEGIICQCDGSEEIINDSYVRIEKEFAGVVVNTHKKVYQHYVPTVRRFNDGEVYVEHKKKTPVDCVAVYYADGYSRIVPVDAITKVVEY